MHHSIAISKVVKYLWQLALAMAIQFARKYYFFWQCMNPLRYLLWGGELSSDLFYYSFKHSIISFI